MAMQRDTLPPAHIDRLIQVAGAAIKLVSWDLVMQTSLLPREERLRRGHDYPPEHWLDLVDTVVELVRWHGYEDEEPE